LALTQEQTSELIDRQSAFLKVFAQGGFDVTVSNPLYIRQELLSPFKRWLSIPWKALLSRSWSHRHRKAKR